MRFVRVSAMPLPVTPPLELPRRLEPPAPVLKVEPPAATAPPVLEAKIVAPEPVRPAPLVQVPTEPPAVRTASEPVRQPMPESRPVHPVGFDTVAAAPSTEPRLTAASTGLFEAPGGARDGRAAARTVASTNFDPAEGRSERANVKQQIASTGFDSAGTASAAPAARQVAASGFSDTRPAAAPVRPVPVPGPVTPVEVLFKPVPLYTDAARQRRVEGAVVLEVEFAASGTVRVLRVIKGLGHGLDEMASQAAAQIRFKPALEDGRPVDHRASIQIVFRLT
jgi:TonB family protein